MSFCFSRQWPTGNDRRDWSQYSDACAVSIHSKSAHCKIEPLISESCTLVLSIRGFFLVRAEKPQIEPWTFTSDLHLIRLTIRTLLFPVIHIRDRSQSPHRVLSRSVDIPLSRQTEFSMKESASAVVVYSFGIYNISALRAFSKDCCLTFFFVCNQHVGSSDIGTTEGATAEC